MYMAGHIICYQSYITRERLKERMRKEKTGRYVKSNVASQVCHQLETTLQVSHETLSSSKIKSIFLNCCDCKYLQPNYDFIHDARETRKPIFYS